jgi:hypothetical protein
MADTGAPWNIPYAEPSDLVRDWPALSEDVADAVAAGLSAAGNPGIGANAVQTVKTDTFTFNSATYVDVTGLDVTITPSSATSRVLIIAQVAHSGGGLPSGDGTYFRLTGGNSGNFVGDADGSRTRAAVGMFYTAGVADSHFTSTIAYVDSPGSASAITYKVQAVGTNSGKINRNNPDTDAASTGRLSSSIIAIEVAP